MSSKLQYKKLFGILIKMIRVKIPSYAVDLLIITTEKVI
jgi:hypothetical protein